MKMPSSSMLLEQLSRPIGSNIINYVYANLIGPTFSANITNTFKLSV